MMCLVKENYTEERNIKPFVNSVNQDWPGFGVSNEQRSRPSRVGDEYNCWYGDENRRVICPCVPPGISYHQQITLVRNRCNSCVIISF